MKTSSGKALGHPKSHCPPSPAPRSRGADSSEAPPGWGGKEGEESGEAPPRRGWAEGDPRLGAPWRPGWVRAASGGARPHSPAPVAPLSWGAQHSASSSQSAQRADVPMVPAWMVPPPPPPLAPHNKLPALPKGGRRWGRGGGRGGGGEGVRRGKGSGKKRAPPPLQLAQSLAHQPALLPRPPAHLPRLQ